MQRIQRLQQIQNLIYRAPRIQRSRLKDFENPLEALSETEFRRRYRFSKDIVHHTIFNLIKEDMKSNHGLSLPPVLQILIGLRFFACGAFQLVVSDTIGVSQSSVHRIIKNLSRSLAKHRPTFLRFPDETEAKSIRTQLFKLGGFPGVTGAIDCTHVRISSPGGMDAEVYRNRKGQFSINVQAVCKPNMQFTNVVARWKGSTHDSRIFDNSRLSVNLSDGVAPGHLVGDSGYPLRKYLLTPIINPARPAEKNYNKGHARTRNPIERAFGVLKRRFNCLGSTLRTKLSTSLVVIVACMVLHNIGIEYNDIWEDEDEEESEADNILVCNLPEETLGKIARQKIIDQYYQ